MRSGPELLVELDRGDQQPLHRRLANGLRTAIRTGRLAPHTRMPSTRVLAADLGVARRLVVDLDDAAQSRRADGLRRARDADPGDRHQACTAKDLARLKSILEGC